MSSSCLVSQGCHLIPLLYLLFFFFCLVLLLFLSCAASANGPFSWLLLSQKIILVPLRERLNSCTALLEEMIVGGTDVELSANYRWYHFYI